MLRYLSQQRSFFCVIPDRFFLFKAFIKQRNYSSSVPVVKIHEKGEPSEFKALFRKWEKPKLPGQTKVVSNRIGMIYYCCFRLLNISALLPSSSKNRADQV